MNMSDYSPFLPLIDVEGGLNRVMKNKKLYFMLLKSFVDKKMVETFQKSIEAGDNAAISSNGHALRGVAANLGLVGLQGITQSIESAAKNGEDFSGFLPEFERIAKESLSMVAALLE